MCLCLYRYTHKDTVLNYLLSNAKGMIINGMLGVCMCGPNREADPGVPEMTAQQNSYHT